MKITINENPVFEETEVTINCKEADESVLKILASLRTIDKKITGLKDEQTFIIPLDSILYIESVDKKTFIYTAKEVFFSPLRLYELEERLSADGFFRISKPTIVNLSQVLSLRPDLGGRLLLTLNNKEKMVVSRQYASGIKEALGI